MQFFTLMNVEHNKYLKSYKYDAGVLRCLWTEKQSEAIRLNEPQIKKFRNFFANYSENQFKARYKANLDYTIGHTLELA